MKNTPDNTICARISGNYFLVFYGYDSREEIHKDLDQLYDAIGEVKFVLPNVKSGEVLMRVDLQVILEQTGK